MSQDTTPLDLRGLLEAIVDARAQVASTRTSVNNDVACVHARLRLLAALETYAAALAVRGTPLPHRLRLELNLYRGLTTGR